MPPRIALSSLLRRFYGNGRGQEDAVTGILGGAGSDPALGDIAISLDTSIEFRLETVDEKQCITHITWTYDLAEVRKNHILVIFVTSDREIYDLIQSARVYPLYELLLVAEEALEKFLPGLRESLRVGISYLDTSGGPHVTRPRRANGEEVALRRFDQYVRLPDHLDPQDLRIVEIDLHDFAHDDDIVDAVRALTLHATNMQSFDLGYVAWTPPFPCFVHSITFDVSKLVRPGESMNCKVHLGTMKGASTPVSQWLSADDPPITVPVESWMIRGHSVRLDYRPLTIAELPDAPEPD
jgi:hypothetical protein